MKESKINIGLLLISIVVCIVYFFIYILNKDNIMAITSISTIVLPFVPYLIQKIFKIKIPNKIKTLYLMFILFSVIMGSVVDLYDTSPGYDKVVHFFSGMVTSIIAIYLLQYIWENKQNLFVYIFLIMTFNIAIAGFWEIIEYTSDIIFGGHAQRGLTDTMQDMICALLGSIIFLLIYTDSKRFKLK